MTSTELDLTQLLKGCEGEEFYTILCGNITFSHIESNTSYPIRCYKGGKNICFTLDGNFYNDYIGKCLIYPSRALYEKYPLDAYSAWMEWQSEQTPKRWRATKYQGYYYIDWRGGRLVTLYDTDEYDKDENNRYDSYNYFRTKEEAQQASEAVRECLEKFHSEHTEN